jgi:DNA-directed RNA polymerase sigma subunit (sigma70/sigma32)
MNNFLNENGCEASIKEILDGVKKEICVDEYEIIKLLNMVKKVISFEKKLDCDDENSISNFIADENSVTKIEEKNIEFILKEIFNNKELDLYGKVLQLRSGIVIYDDFEYIGPYPLIICADILKKTKDEIRFLEVIAYKKIRENNNYKKFIKLNSKE